jgi:hypothetical protein
MAALTRRKDPDRPDRWDIYFGDIAIGSIGKMRRRASSRRSMGMGRWVNGWLDARDQGRRHGREL